jgi:hypothetical protein
MTFNAAIRIINNPTSISHCEILNEKKGLSANMDNEVSYSCLKCPFNCYTKKEII